MILRKWDDIPLFMKNESVRKYYDLLQNKRFSLCAKRIFDVVVSFILLILLSPVFIILSILIMIDSRGPVLFRQTRVTQYGRHFKILKFRTMVNNAETIGTQVTVSNDARITRVGRYIRKCRLDEIPQLINIIKGEMSFVGTRPEVVKYVEKYSDEMMATLLLPAGVTSNASIEYRDEEKILDIAEDIDEVYINTVLPGKMVFNLNDIIKFSLLNEVKPLIKTVFTVLKKKENVVEIRSVNSEN